MIMKTRLPLLECIPNFSEGRDRIKIDKIASAIRSVEGIELLHIDISPAANRTVMTFAGLPQSVSEAAFRAIQCAAEEIDMQTQTGVHPRIGATDVCPFVPLSNIHLEEANEIVNNLCERVGNELKIPIYLYEHSAKNESRKALPDLRRGQYEGLEEKMKQPNWIPDNKVVFNAKAGATVMGVRDILVAFNISLSTDKIEVANFIASRIRERGRKENGKYVAGILPKVRAIGWYMADYNCVQVSFNLLDYRITSLLQVWQTCEMLAAEAGVELVGSEVIGLIPERCLIEAGTFSFLRKNESVPKDNLVLIESARSFLGLNKLKPFDPREKVLEYALEHAGLLS